MRHENVHESLHIEMDLSLRVLGRRKRDAHRLGFVEQGIEISWGDWRHCKLLKSCSRVLNTFENDKTFERDG
jgi:hypothetical protein